MKINTLENQNKGLTTRFVLVEGKFNLIGGTAKVDDNMGMLLSFVGWFRFYNQDYVIDAYQLFQNTTSFLYAFKNILRLKILDIGKKYVPFAKFIAVDIPNNYSDRKSTEVVVEYQYNLKDLGMENNNQLVKKIIQ